jgi:hypothetical protein
MQLSLWPTPWKRCSTCRELKPLEEFNRRTTAPDGRQWNCRACNARWHVENKQRHNQLIHERTARIRMEHAQFLLDYLRDHPCVDCGEADPVVLEFDHLGDKTRAVSAMAGWSMDAVIAEIAKCEVVCANCHRRRTAMRAGSYRFRSTRTEGASGDASVPPGV